MPLPELKTRRCLSADPDFTITTGSDVAPSDDLEWIHHWLDDDDACDLSLARLDDGYLLRFPDLADIVLENSGMLRIAGLEGVSARTLRHLMLDQVLPRALAHRGNLVLHASAVATAHGAVVFLGLSGRGKSTLACAMAAQSGGGVLADDCIVATQDGSDLLAVPTYPGLRLWPESVASLFPGRKRLRRVTDYSDKRRIDVDLMGHAADASYPIAAIMVLDRACGDTDIRITALDSSSACMALVSNSFQLDVSDVQQVYRLLGLAAGAAQRTSVLSLRYPRDYAALPGVVQAILDHLNTPKPG